MGISFLVALAHPGGRVTVEDTGKDVPVPTPMPGTSA